MRFNILIFILSLGCGYIHAAETDSLTLTLDGAIRLARDNSPSAQSARNTFLSAYWNWRYYKANYLPSVTLTSSPYINKEMNKITQSDGTA
ncbi:MAG: TolC family protein, partial [Muribaculaceae bacterium]|nr:TolC family protein [Muribaculaceae bacterium]